MKKTMSIFCALVLLLSVCTVFTLLPVSAETQKYVTGDVILPDGTQKTLNTFVYEDFENYDTTDVFATPYISKYVDEAVEYLGTEPKIQTAADLNGYGMYVTTNANYKGNNAYRQAAISIHPAYWQPGNKVTKLSFDVQNVGAAQIRTYFLWAKELDETGYTTGTAGDTSAVLGSYLFPGVGYGASCNIGNTVGNGSKDLTGGYKPLYGADNSDAGTDAHFEITVTYSNVTETSLRANFTVAIYPFQASGDYSEVATFTGTTYTYTADYDCSSVPGMKIEDLTLVPMINPIINFGNGTYDNIKVESTDLEALAYVKAHGAAFEGTDEAAWQAATLALNSQQTLVQKRLAYYAGCIAEHYAAAERMVTDDFSDAFKSSMFWSNYNNLKIENGSVVGNQNTAIASFADGSLTKNKALSVVYLKNVQGYNQGTAISASANTVTSLYSLYCETNGLTVAAPVYLYGNSNGTYQFRIDPHGGLETWQNICIEKAYGNFAYSSTNPNEARMTDIDLAIFYDWSKYNAENNYQITLTYTVKYKVNGTGDYRYVTGRQPLHLGTAVKDGNDFVSSDVSAFAGNIPAPADFKFGLRNIGSVDSVSVFTTDETSGMHANTGLYFNSTDEADKNNGALVFTMQNKTFAEDTLATVTDYGALFINKGTLTAQNLDEGALALDTDKAIKISAKENGLEGNATYNVRINGTQNQDWAAQKIVARTYVTYKIGTDSYTVYGDTVTLSNMANIKAVAQNHNIDLTGKSFEDAVAAISAARYGA